MKHGVCPMFEIYTFSCSTAAAYNKVVYLNVLFLFILRILETQRGYHTLKMWSLHCIMK
jgi:hypothetical protein